jgi:cyclase
MEVIEVRSSVTAFVRPEEGANASLVHTADGEVVIDTTSCAADMQLLLDTAQVRPSDVCLVINTHQHSDHTWGNQLFGCPILAHRFCNEAMVANIDGPWQMERIAQSIGDRGVTDPEWAAEMRKKVDGLRITLPTETFENRRDLAIGGVRMEVIHMGGHTRGSSVVWLPESKVLLAGDLLFVGRYPFIGDADIPDLIRALKRLPEFGAAVVIPGHGPLCGEAEIAAMLDYIQDTWSRTVDHLTQGHTADEATADPGYPRYAEGAAERYHEANIRAMYAQLAPGEACPL